MTGDTLQSRICIIAAPQLKPAPKALKMTLCVPSSFPANSLDMVSGTEVLLVLPYFWMQWGTRDGSAFNFLTKKSIMNRLA